jgi:hypothetical protein
MKMRKNTIIAVFCCIALAGTAAVFINARTRYYRCHAGQVYILMNNHACWNGLLPAPTIEFRIPIWSNPSKWKPSENQIRSHLKEWSDRNKIEEKSLRRIVASCVSLNEFNRKE